MRRVVSGAPVRRHTAQLPVRLYRRGRRRFQAVGSTVSIASSTVTIPSSASLLVDHRHGQQVVPGDHLRDLLLRREGADGHRLVVHELADRHVRPGHDQVAQREHAHQPLLRVDHVDVVDGLGIGLELAELLDGLGRGQVLGDGHVRRGHDAARGVLRVAEQLAHLLGLVLLHQRQDLRLGLLGQVGDQVGRVVRAHLLEDVGGTRGLQVLQHVDLGLGLHLLHGVGHRLVVEGGEHAGPVARGQLVDDRRQVGRVELPEALVGDAEADRRDRRLDRVDVLPVDVALGDADVQVARDRPPLPLDPQPPQQARGPDVHGHQVQLALDLVEPEVVDPHDTPPVDVDDLLVLQVHEEEELVRTLLELADVDGRGREACAGGVERRDVAPGHEDLAAPGHDDETRDRRVPVADGDDQVGDLADRLTLAVAHGPADHLAQVELHLPPRWGAGPAPPGGTRRR